MTDLIGVGSCIVERESQLKLNRVSSDPCSSFRIQLSISRQGQFASCSLFSSQEKEALMERESLQVRGSGHEIAHTSATRCHHLFVCPISVAQQPSEFQAAKATRMILKPWPDKECLPKRTTWLLDRSSVSKLKRVSSRLSRLRKS